MTNRIEYEFVKASINVLGIYRIYKIKIDILHTYLLL